jgi:hypothetical protein
MIPLPAEPFLAPLAIGALLVVIVTLVEPVAGLYLFVIAMFAEGAALSIGTGVTAAKLVGILAFGAWLVHSLSSGRFRIEIPPQGLVAIVLVVWGVVSAGWAIDADLVFDRTQILVQSLALYVMVINLVDSDRRLQDVLHIIIATSVVLALMTIFRVLTGVAVQGRVDIASISALDPNEQAAYLLPSVACLMNLVGRKMRVGRRVLYILAFIIIVLAILATYSRGAMVSLMAMLVCGLLLDRKTWALLPAIPFVGVVSFFLLPPAFIDRFESIFTLPARGAGRLDIWLVGTRIIKAHPVLGVGLGNFGEAFSKYLPNTPGVRRAFEQGMGPHNVLVGVFGELGVVGLVLFIIVIGLTIIRAAMDVMRSERASELQVDALVKGIVLGLIGMLVASMFVDLRYRKIFWLFLALAEVPRRLPLHQEEFS